MTLDRMSHKFEKGCEARQSEIRAGSVLAHVTKRIAAITPPRALVVLRFLLNTTEETDRFRPNPITLCYLNNYIRSAETGEIFGLDRFNSHMDVSNQSDVTRFSLMKSQLKTIPSPGVCGTMTLPSASIGSHVALR